jgi:hypothetical protein
MEGGAVGHNFEMELHKDHPCQVWFNSLSKLCPTARPSFKMAAVTENRNFFHYPLLL